MSCNCKMVEAMAGFLGCDADLVPAPDNCAPGTGVASWACTGRTVTCESDGLVRWEGIMLDASCEADRYMISGFMMCLAQTREAGVGS